LERGLMTGEYRWIRILPGETNFSLKNASRT
jgi:hypothetical protein